MTQLVIDGKIIDIEEKINYNFQVSDVAEIKGSKSNYTSSFKIRRTSDVVKIFDGLGVPADTSRAPYVIKSVDLLDSYTPILHSGALLIHKTDSLYYHVAVISGTYDFFTEIGDTKISDLDIYEIIHDKTPDNVNAGLRGERIYKYFFAHFGGMSHYVNGAMTVNTDFMTPAVPAKYLWDKIFAKFPRFTYSGNVFDSDDFNTLDVTFPVAPPNIRSDQQTSLVLGREGVWDVDFGGDDRITGFESWTTVNNYDTHLLVFDNWVLSPRVSGLFRLDIANVVGQALYGTNGGPEEFVFAVQVNFNEVIRVNSHAGSTTENDGTVELRLNVGDRVDFVIYRKPGKEGERVAIRLDIISLNFTRYITSFDDRNKIYALKVTDFIKEIMWRYSLIAFVDTDHIEFVSLSEIIESSEVVDWTKKYIGRLDETYTLGYARNNYVKHKYDEEEADYFDRNIRVDNRNLEANKNIIESKFYAPSFRGTDYIVHPNFNGIFERRTYPVFSGEGSETSDFDTEARNFFVRMYTENVPYRIGSKDMGGEIDVPTPTPVFREDFSTLQFVSNPYYDALIKILDDTRVHRISLLLSATDVSQIDFKKLYFFQQEGAFYMLNKLQFKKGEVAKGEFIKIRK